MCVCVCVAGLRRDRSREGERWHSCKSAPSKCAYARLAPCRLARDRIASISRAERRSAPRRSRHVAKLALGATSLAQAGCEDCAGPA